MIRVVLVCLFAAAVLPAGTVPLESARNIPVAEEVDVVVAGGSTGAVAAAVAAAETGARVFLVAPQAYLGEDLCATMRLWLEPDETPEAPLARKLFSDPDGRGPFRPMHIKKTLDEALLAANVRFLYSSYVTDLLRDGRSRPAGVVIANRAGRQAILAKAIIDGTERAAVARLAGARFHPFPSGPQAFCRIVIAREVKTAPGLTARKTGLHYRVEADPKAKPPLPAPYMADLIEYRADVEMPDGSFAAYARAEQVLRDLTYSDTEQANTDWIFHIPPDRIRGAKSVKGKWPGAARLDLGCFRPAGVPRVFVLSAMADIPREHASRLMRPLELMAAGARVGVAAAQEARRAPVPAAVSVRADKRAEKFAAAAGNVKEALTGLRPAAASTRLVPSPARSIPVLGAYDVVVVGGGTGGAPAGIAAARKGAKTLVLEYLHGLGGVGTMGLISTYYFGYRGGFTKEVPGARTWNPLQRAEWWRRTLRQAGAEIWFGAIGCGAFVKGNRVAGVVVATPQGRGVVLAKVVIDATGNADIAAAAGAETMYTDGSELAQQGTGLPRLTLGPGYTNTDFTITDETDMLDVWHLMVYAKNKYASDFDMGQLVDTRERRRIVGDFVMSFLDQVNHRRYPDTIAVAHSNFDTHGYTVDPYFLLDHPQKKPFDIDVPYRCFVPKGLDTIFVIGLGVSAHRDAIPMIRMQPDVQNHGYAIGLAAATLARTEAPVRSLDVRSLQKELVAIGIVPERVLTDRDAYPISDHKVAEAVKLKNVGIILAKPETSSPLLRRAWREASGEDRLVYAHILAVLGDATGLETLIEAVDSQPWDAGWKFRGGGQFGPALSPLDTMIIAMGRTHDRRALPAILRKAAALNATSEFSHWRAVALALEAIADPTAAPVLAELLARPGIAGHAHLTVETARERSGPSPGDNTTRDLSIRELGLARALFRCGDHNGLGARILQQYARDLRGHFVRHAKAVLEDARTPPR